MLASATTELLTTDQRSPRRFRLNGNALKRRINPTPTPAMCFTLFSVGHSESSIIGATGVDKKQAGSDWDPREAEGPWAGPPRTASAHRPGACAREEKRARSLIQEISMGLLVGLASRPARS